MPRDDHFEYLIKTAWGIYQWPSLLSITLYSYSYSYSKIATKNQYNKSCDVPKVATICELLKTNNLNSIVGTNVWQWNIFEM